ncbi:hypothetical protein HYV64_00345 [Candidatus Shapirobacteria bacterium]|nr:hypothetical protein [Candidatus Shapirobacteria bacterium]
MVRPKNSFHCMNQALSGTNSIGFFKVIEYLPACGGKKKIKNLPAMGDFFVSND